MKKASKIKYFFPSKIRRFSADTSRGRLWGTHAEVEA
jgi:hypothetical protein